MTKLWLYEIGAKTEELLQRRDVENQHRNVVENAETEKPDITTFPKDVATFRLVFGRFLAHFEPRIGGFESKNPKETRRGRLGLGGVGLCPHFGTIDREIGMETP